MMGKLHELIRHLDAVLHTVETDLQKIQFEVLVQHRFFFNHTRYLQNQFLPVQIELMTNIQQII